MGVWLYRYVGSSVVLHRPPTYERRIKTTAETDSFATLQRSRNRSSHRLPRDSVTPRYHRWTTLRSFSTNSNSDQALPQRCSIPMEPWNFLFDRNPRSRFPSSRPVGGPSRRTHQVVESCIHVLRRLSNRSPRTHLIDLVPLPHLTTTDDQPYGARARSVDRSESCKSEADQTHLDRTSLAYDSLLLFLQDFFHTDRSRP